MLPSSGGDGLPIEGEVPGPAAPLLPQASACPPSPPYGHSFIKSGRPPGRYTAGVQPPGRMCSEKHKAASPAAPLHPCGRSGAICGHHPPLVTRATLMGQQVKPKSDPGGGEGLSLGCRDGGQYQHDGRGRSHEGIQQSPLQGEPAAGEGDRLVSGQA